MNTSKGNERISDEGAVEIKVETVDYRKPAGQEEEPRPEKVAVTHLVHDEKSGGGGGAAAKLAEKLPAASEAVGDTISRMQ